MSRFLAALAILLTCTALHASAQTTGGTPVVADLARTSQPVIHGFGQGIFRWDTDAVPYFEAMDNQPALYSIYATFTDIRAGATERLEQIRRMSRGWTDPQTGQEYPMVPVLGLGSASIDFRLRQDTLSAEFFRQLGITEDVQAQYGIGAPTFEMSIFVALSQLPELWEAVKDTLDVRGLFTDDIDLDALLADGSEAAIYRLVALRDSAIVLANDRLLDRGFPFGDLAILDGTFDPELLMLADSVAAVGSPVIIRFLYESVSGFSRPYIYSSETFVEAYRRLISMMRARGATNAEFMFHANNGNRPTLEEWYPGDEFIDWTGTSIFDPINDPTGLEREAAFASSHGRAFMVVESSPTAAHYRPDNIRYPGLWDEWFLPYFEFLKAHADAFVYIGIDWGQLTGAFDHWGNARVQENPELLTSYRAELATPAYMHNAGFWQALRDNVTATQPLPEASPALAVYPNPASASEPIALDLPGPGRVTITDLLGRRVFSAESNRGGTIRWLPSVAPGVYVVSHSAGHAALFVVR